MTDYKVSYVVRGEEMETLLRKVFASLYLAEIEGESVRLSDVSHPEQGEFEFPATQRLIKHLNEQPTAPAGEGDWQLSLDAENKLGDDTE